uniref:(northern house mosquito) hypothetical protein n=1 Tax=Culex pipiens TaxID=7175 RepID=A0A8D8D3P6_CULPI
MHETSNGHCSDKRKHVFFRSSEQFDGKIIAIGTSRKLNRGEATQPEGNLRVRNVNKKKTEQRSRFCTFANLFRREIASTSLKEVQKAREIRHACFSFAYPLIKSVSKVKNWTEHVGKCLSSAGFCPSFVVLICYLLV